MKNKDFKRLLLKAYIQGMSDEVIWYVKWNELPYIGKYRRIKKFLIWYNSII
jgi:hypothetical protein